MVGDQLTALLSEYNTLRQEFVTLTGMINTFGGLTVTILAVVLGLMIQIQQTEYALAVPAIGLIFVTQMSRLEMSTRYLIVHLKSIEARVNKQVGPGTMTWHGAFDSSLPRPSAGSNEWAIFTRAQSMNENSNSVLLGVLVLVMLVGFGIGAWSLIGRDPGSLWAEIALVLVVLFYSVGWSVWLVNAVFRNRASFVTEAERAHEATLRMLTFTGGKLGGEGNDEGV